MAETNSILFKCIMQQSPVVETAASKKVQDVIDLVTSTGLLIKHPDGCFTINPSANPHTRTIQGGVRSAPNLSPRAARRAMPGARPSASQLSGPRGKRDSKMAELKQQKKEKRVRSCRRPWTVSSRQLRSKRSRTRRDRRRLRRRQSRSSTRSGTHKWQRKSARKNLRVKRSAHKKRTYRKLYKIKRRPTYYSTTSISRRK